jgi:hypothetical protein
MPLPSSISRRPLAVAGAVLCTLLAGGCASQVKLTGAWADGAPRDRAFGRVLVVGVSPDYNQRCAFEWSLAQEVRSDGVAVLASCDAMSSQVELTRQNVERVIRERQIDAVLATTLVDANTKVEEGGTRDTRGHVVYKAVGTGWETGYYGLYGVPVVYGELATAPSLLTLQGEVAVRTRVFDTAGPALVYTVETRAAGLEGREQGLMKLTPPIAEKLRRDGVLR